MARSATPQLTEGSQHKTDAEVHGKYKGLINLFVFTVHFLHLAALPLTVPKRQKEKKMAWRNAKSGAKTTFPLSLPTLQVL